jgi:capsular polysaccharide biosynthesis protein
MPQAYEDEINLYDYWKIIAKRKRLIIGLFLTSIIFTGIISLFMPKIYRGDAIIKIKTLNSLEMASIIGDPNKKKIEYLPKTYHSVISIKMAALKNSTDKLHVTVEAKSADDITAAILEFVEHIDRHPLIKQEIDREKERLKLQVEELSKILKASDELIKTYDKLLKTNKLIPIGFNPIDLGREISDIKIEKYQIEQALQQLEGAKIVEQPYISETPVKPNIKKNIALAGITSLFAGIFLSFLLNLYKK